MEEKIRRILSQFQLDGEPICCERYGQGHINATYLVTEMEKKWEAIQRIAESFR